MGLCSMNFWRRIGNHARGQTAAAYTTSTSPRMQPYVPAADHKHFRPLEKLRSTSDYFPVFVALGMIALSVSLGLFTAQHQMLHSPNVRVKKKMRETVPEVSDPDKVVDEADKFLKKSFFRKVAHVQDLPGETIPDTIRKDVFANTPSVETLKSVGVDPKLK